MRMRTLVATKHGYCLDAGRLIIGPEIRPPFGFDVLLEIGLEFRMVIIDYMGEYISMFAIHSQCIALIAKSVKVVEELVTA